MLFGKALFQQLDDYFAGKLKEFDIPYFANGHSLSANGVGRAFCRLDYGEVINLFRDGKTHRQAQKPQEQWATPWARTQSASSSPVIEWFRAGGKIRRLRRRIEGERISPQTRRREQNKAMTHST